MPDLERVLDQMRVDFAETPEDKARAIGFIDGKNKARREIAIVVVSVVVCGLLVWMWYLA